MHREALILDRLSYFHVVRNYVWKVLKAALEAILQSASA